MNRNAMFAMKYLPSNFTLNIACVTIRSFSSSHLTAPSAA